jgi:hypothetical protein
MNVKGSVSSAEEIVSSLGKHTKGSIFLFSYHMFVKVIVYIAH